MPSFPPITVLLGLLAAVFVHADFVEPYPASDCSAAIGFGYASCPNQPGCCAGGAACCAGGCCPITAWCVNQGLSNEGCCPLSDTSNCGATVASFSQPACTDGAFDPKPSVSCTSADDDWYCPPGNVCGSTYPMCFPFNNPGCSSGGSDTTPSPTPTPGSTSAVSESASLSPGTSTTGGGVRQTGRAAALQKPVFGVLGAIGTLLGLVW